MINERLMKVILAPVISEKGTNVAERNNQKVFRVCKNATKIEIKSAVELIFNVEVVAVSTLMVKGKSLRFRGVAGRKQEWKKAYVTFAEEVELDMALSSSAQE